MYKKMKGGILFTLYLYCTTILRLKKRLKLIMIYKGITIGVDAICNKLLLLKCQGCRALGSLALGYGDRSLGPSSPARFCPSAVGFR